MSAREAGWVKLHRRILSSPVWKLTHTQLRVFVALLLVVNRDDSTVIVGDSDVVVPAGSTIKGYRTIARVCRVSRNTTHQAIVALQKMGIVASAPACPGARVYVLRVVQWSKYQSDEGGPVAGPPWPTEGAARSEGWPTGRDVGGPLAGPRSRREKLTTTAGAAADPPPASPKASARTRRNGVNGSDHRAGLEDLKRRLDAAYLEAKGEQLDSPKSAWGDLTAVRKVCGSDDEVLRRWALFLADAKFYPVKSYNRFRAAYQNTRYSNGKPPENPLPGIPEFS